MTILTVGAGQQFSTLNAAIAASHDGDILNVQAGTYTNDFATINTKITINGIGGMVSLVATQPPPNGKAILTTETDVTLDHIEFSGASVSDANGAGIRYEGGNLVITNSYFHNNQDGILAADAPGGTITIDHSEFGQNGAGDGRSHNIYVNEIATLKITNSYFHDAVVGHEIKSRADNTIITNNRIFDNTGSASYSIDLPNGGAVTIQNNIIEQGRNSQNPSIIAYAEETSTPYANSSLTVGQNTILNDLASGSSLAVWNTAGAVNAQITGNSFYGLTSAQIASGSNTQSGDVFLSSEPALDTSHPWSTGSGSGTSATTTGTTGNDVFAESSANQVFNGNGGHDMLVFTGASSGYTVANNSGIITVTDSVAGRDGADQVSNVEFLKFTDKTLFVEGADNASVARLYAAAFNRAPDTAGLSGWENIYGANVPASAKGNGFYMPLAQTSAGYNGGMSLAAGFTNSTEFQQKYGVLDNAAFVNLLYNNVLGRTGAASEVSDWTHLMTAGDSNGLVYTRDMVLVGFAESPANIAKTGSDWLMAV